MSFLFMKLCSIEPVACIPRSRCKIKVWEQREKKFEALLHVPVDGEVDRWIDRSFVLNKGEKKLLLQSLTLSHINRSVCLSFFHCAKHQLGFTIVHTFETVVTTQ